MVTNGNIPLTELVQRGGVYLWPSTAARFDLMNADLVRLGHPLMRISTPLGGYRSIADQVEAKRLYGRTAATPGYSNHGFGRAFDVNNISRYPDAVIGLAGLKHGLIRNAGNGAGGIESWHFYDTSGIMPTVTSTSGSEPVPITVEEEDMFSDNDRALLIAVKAALLDGVAEEGMARSRLDVIFESANRIRGARTIAGGAPNPEYVYGDVLQWIRTEIRAVGKADAKTLAAELAPLLGLPDVVAKISDADVDRLVKKLLDEQARRLTA